MCAGSLRVVRCTSGHCLVVEAPPPYPRTTLARVTLGACMRSLPFPTDDASDGSDDGEEGEEGGEGEEEAEEDEEDEEDGADLKEKYMKLNAKEEAKAARLAAKTTVDAGTEGADGDAEEGEAGEADGDKKGEKGGAPAAPARRPSDVTEGRTIFVRGVPFDVEEEGLVQQFSAFGRVVYAKIVKDKATGVSRGTAFVQVCVCVRVFP